MRLRQLAGAWYGWLDARQARLDEEAKSNDRMNRVLQRFLRSALARAWLTWRDNHLSLRQQRQKLAGCLRRMERRGMVAAFNTWCEVMDLKREVKQRMERAVARMRSAAAAAAFSRWEEAVRESQLERVKQAYLISNNAGRAAVLEPPLRRVAARVATTAARLEGLWEGAFLSRERKAKLADLRARGKTLSAVLPTLGGITRAEVNALHAQQHKVRRCRLNTSG